MHTASGSDRILEQNWHDLNSFRPQNLHASYYGLCCSACKAETGDTAGPEFTSHAILAPTLWAVAYAESSHTPGYLGGLSVEVNLRPTVSRQVCLGVGHLSGTLDQFFFLLQIFFRQLRVCYFVAPSLTWGRFCNLLYNCFWALPEQSLLSHSPAELTAIFTISFETPPTISSQMEAELSASRASRSLLLRNSCCVRGWVDPKAKVRAGRF
jgi:hypothetical protein